MASRKTTAAPAKETAVKKAEPAKAEETVKETLTKQASAREEQKGSEKKTPAKKAAAQKTAVKTAPKTAKTGKTEKEAASQKVYIQFAGREVLTEDILEKVRNEWVAEGHRVSSIKSLELYVKPEENTAYYVLNGKVTGSVEF